MNSWAQEGPFLTNTVFVTFEIHLKISTESTFNNKFKTTFIYEQ